MKSIFLSFFGVILFSVPPPAALAATVFSGPVEEVFLSPSPGSWGFRRNANLAYNPLTNRLAIVLTDSVGRNRVVHFDASTKAFENGSPPLYEAGFSVLDTAVLTESNDLLIAWERDSEKVNQSTEASFPAGLERFDLDTFDSADSIILDASFFYFEVDRTRNEVIGISRPREGGSDYLLERIDLASNTVAFSASIGIATSEALLYGALYDASSGRLATLWSQTSAPNIIDTTSFLRAYDSVSGDLVASSTPFEGEFGKDGFTLSADLRRLVVLTTRGGAGKALVFDADTLAQVGQIEGSDIAAGFAFAGTAFFRSDNTLLLGNHNQFDAIHSLAEFDVQTSSLVGFIASATRVELIAEDPLSGTLFLGSQTFDAVHVVEAGRSDPSANIEIELPPASLAFDPDNNHFCLLSDRGYLYLVSGQGEFLGRRLNFAIDPQGGILADPLRDRILAARQTGTPPVAVENHTYQTLANLPVPADAFTIDTETNRIYTASADLSGFPQARFDLHEIDGENYEVLRSLGEIPFKGNRDKTAEGPFDRPVAGMAVDSSSGFLWVLSRAGFFNQVPALRAFSLTSSASFEYVHPSTKSRLGNLVLDRDRDQILFTLQPTQPVDYTELLIFESSPAFIGQPTLTQLPAHAVDDVAADFDHGLLYFLARDRSDLFPRLLVFDLLTLATREEILLDFTTTNRPGVLAFDAHSNRFAYVPGEGERMFLFSNPVDPSIRPEPIPAETFSPGSVQVREDPGAATLRWEWDADSETSFRRLFVERRLSGTDNWSRLTPVGLDSDISSWTDTTTSQGGTYDYRLQPVLGAAETLPDVEVPPSPSAWKLDSPDLLLWVEKGKTRSFLARIGASVAQLPGASIEAIAGFPLTATLDLQLIPQPGTARCAVTVAEEAAEGVYPVQLVARRGGEQREVTVQIAVADSTAQLTTDRILRQTLPISLSSDSDLATRRISVRGQVGVLRSKTNPVPVRVIATPPSGPEMAAHVVASTGEFTASFSIPDPFPEGDWRFTAEIYGTPDLVGGKSRDLVVPLSEETGGKSTKGIGTTDIGEVILVQGEPKAGGNDDLPLFGTNIQREFEDLRFDEERRRDLVSPTAQDIQSTAGESAAETARFVLIYFYGDAEIDPVEGIRFRNGEEGITPSDLEAIVNEIAPNAAPLVILDCPYASRFKEHFEGLAGGAMLFSATNEWGSISFRPSAYPFTFSGYFLGFLPEFGFGESYAMTSDSLSYTDGITGRTQSPSEINANLDPPNYKLPVGSSFVEPRGDLNDRFGPVFREVTSSLPLRLGEDLALYARLEDAPFETVSGILVEVVEPEGTVTQVELTAEDSRTFSGRFTTKYPGPHYLRFTAVDEANNLSPQDTIVEVGVGKVTPEELLSILAGLTKSGIQSAGFDSILFRTSSGWYEEENR
jgi:hypothetical protein